jgi:hypothetical protein
MSASRLARSATTSAISRRQQYIGSGADNSPALLHLQRQKTNDLVVRHSINAALYLQRF